MLGSGVFIFWYFIIDHSPNQTGVHVYESSLAFASFIFLVIPYESFEEYYENTGMSSVLPCSRLLVLFMCIISVFVWMVGAISTSDETDPNVSCLIIGQYIVVSLLTSICQQFQFHHAIYGFIKVTKLDDQKFAQSMRTMLINAMIKQANIHGWMIFFSIIYLAANTAIFQFKWIFEQNQTLLWYINIAIIMVCDAVILMLLLFSKGIGIKLYNYPCVCCCALSQRCCTWCCMDSSSTTNITSKGLDAMLLSVNNQNQGISISAEDNGCKNIQKCQHVQYIENALCNYQDTADEMQLSKLINAFHHLLQYHDDSASFNFVNKGLQEVKTCEIDNCICYYRNCGDRSHGQFYEYKQDDRTINVLEAMIDQIHLYYFHSYDMSMRSRENDACFYNDKTNSVKSTKYSYNAQNKFNSVITTISKPILNENNENMYSFGERFSYDDTDEKHVLNVTAKHASLKDEALNNHICQIRVIKYHEIIQKSQGFMMANYVKQMVQNKFFPNKDDCVSIDHIISLLLYCNCDQYQQKWSSTFRRIPATEKNETLTERHAHFYHSTVNLLDLIENYGTNLMYNKDNKFYHGINKELYFDKTITQFKCPLSTSSELLVAYNFSNNAGIVLELQYSSSTYPLHAKYFDCQYFSDFVGEKECLFLGGIPILIISNIINVTNGEVYKRYIDAINVINAIMTSQELSLLTGSQIKLCHDILLAFLNQSSVISKYPTYAIKLFQKYCNNLTHGIIDFKHLSKYPLLRQLLFTSNESTATKAYSVRINILLLLFPNLYQIEYIHSSSKCRNCFIKDIKTERLSNRNLRLRYVIFHGVMSPIGSKKMGITTFSNTSWSVFVDSNKLIFYRGSFNIKMIQFKYDKLSQAVASQAIVDNCKPFR